MRFHGLMLLRDEADIIAESLTQFKKTPDAPALPDLKDQSVAS